MKSWLRAYGIVNRWKTPTDKAPLAVPAGTAPGTDGLPWGQPWRAAVSVPPPRTATVALPAGCPYATEGPRCEIRTSSAAYVNPTPALASAIVRRVLHGVGNNLERTLTKATRSAPISFRFAPKTILSMSSLCLAPTFRLSVHSSLRHLRDRQGSGWVHEIRRERWIIRRQKLSAFSALLFKINAHFFTISTTSAITAKNRAAMESRYVKRTSSRV